MPFVSATPGTSGMMPEIRKMVTGHRFRTANHRDMRITMTVAAKVAIETEL